MYGGSRVRVGLRPDWRPEDMLLCPTGSSLARFRCGVVSSRAAASLTVVHLRVVLQREPVLLVKVDQAARPGLAT